MERYQQREAIKRAYPYSKTWPGKVNQMSDLQVYAIFVKFKQKGIIR